MNSRYKDLLPLWIAVSKLETANYQSALYKRFNNAFGMNKATTRRTSQRGGTAELYNQKFEGMSKGVYSDVMDSFQDIVYWMDYTNFPTSVKNTAQFARELKKRGYFEVSESDYLKALQSWL